MNIEAIIFNAILVVLILWSNFVGQYSLQRCKEEELLREGNVRGANSFYLRGIIISLASVAFCAEFLIFSVVSQQGTFSICIFGGVVLYYLFLAYKAIEKYQKFRKVAEFHTGGPIILGGVEEEKDPGLRLTLLTDCKAEPVGEDMSSEELLDKYLKAYKEGKHRGFIPVYLEYFSGLFDNVIKEGRKRLGQDADAKALVTEAIQQNLSAELDAGEAVLAEAFQRAKNILDDEEWEHLTTEKTDDEDFMPEIDDLFTIDDLLAQIPVKNPWDVFAYFATFFNDNCERLHKCRAAAKYWYEKYGAVPCFIAYGEAMFYLPKPIPQEDASIMAKQIFALSLLDDTIPNIESRLRHGAKFFSICVDDYPIANY